jgi:hypothetical protein
MAEKQELSSAVHHNLNVVMTGINDKNKYRFDLSIGTHDQGRNFWSFIYQSV